MQTDICVCLNTVMVTESPCTHNLIVIHLPTKETKHTIIPSKDKFDQQTQKVSVHITIILLSGILLATIIWFH